jgi:ElaB/YqjD/DUF883 family membrane-anchored ribosome-binding protein
MDHESEVMREQMQETRTSLQDKLETLEQHVKDTVLETTDAVTGTVEAVKETVESVKETVQETVQSVKDTFNLSHMVKEHPWPVFFGAIGIGFVGGRLLGSIPSGGPSPAEAARPAPRPEQATHRNGFSGSKTADQRPAAPRRGWLNLIADHYSDELAKIKGLAIATVGNVVCQMVIDNAAPQIAARTKELIDGIVVKFGAEPLDGPILGAGPASVEQGNVLAKPY